MGTIKHLHYMARLECDNVTGPHPKDSADLEEMMDTLIIAIGMKVCMPTRSVYVIEQGNEGVTYNAGLETSHLAGHEWCNPNRKLMHTDAQNLVQFDLYTCGKLGKAQQKIITKLLRSYYKPQRMELLIIDRAKQLRNSTIYEYIE